MTLITPKGLQCDKSVPARGAHLHEKDSVASGDDWGAGYNALGL